MPTEDMKAAAVAALATEVAMEAGPPWRRRPHEHPLMDDHACDGLPRKWMALTPAKRLGDGPFCH